MKNNRTLFFIVWMALSFLFTGVQFAGDEDKDDIFSGYFTVGYRGVDVDGHMSKYKEDYNLQDGPKLMTLKLSYKPIGKVKAFFDRMDVRVYHLGGEPFESFSANIVKYGKFDFKMERRKSNYYYKDHFVGHDFHHYDFDRINDSASLKIWLCNFSRLYFNFNSYSKKGHSTTSLDVSRDEFEFESPVDETSKEFSVGLDLSLKRVSILLEEKIQDYKNDYSFFLLGGKSHGEHMDDMAMLDYFYLSQPYDFRSFTHTFKVSARPMDKLLIKANGQLSNQDLRMDYAEDISGVTYLGSDYTNAYSGEGNFDRKIGLFDFDLSYLINYNIAIVAAVRYKKFEQEGSFNVYGAEMPMYLDYNTLGLEGGLQYQVNSKFTFTLGFRNEKREVMHSEDATGGEETKRTGLFGNLKLKLSKALRMTADYQYGSYTDPFTSISPTDFHRFRCTFKYKGKNLFLNGSFQYKLSENDLDDMWKNERSQLNLRAGYFDKKVKFGMGYNLIYSKNEGDRNFNFYGRSVTWNILNEGRTSLFDAYLYYKLDKKISVGAHGNYYKNDGYWELERTIIKPFIKYSFDNGFIGKLSYVYIDYKEIEYGMNNYNADIFEISFGYKW